MKLIIRAAMSIVHIQLTCQSSVSISFLFRGRNNTTLTLSSDYRSTMLRAWVSMSHGDGTLIPRRRLYGRRAPSDAYHVLENERTSVGEVSRSVTAWLEQPATRQPVQQLRHDNRRDNNTLEKRERGARGGTRVSRTPGRQCAPPCSLHLEEVDRSPLPKVIPGGRGEGAGERTCRPPSWNKMELKAA